MAHKNHPLTDLLNTYRALGFDNLPVSTNRGASPQLETDTYEQYDEQSAEHSGGQSNQATGTNLHTPPEIPQTSPQVSLQESPRVSPQAAIVRPRATVEKEKLLAGICEDIGECTRCRLHEHRQHIVFGEGSADTRLMFIGEAPGGDEDVQARPFVGRAGKLLTSLINKLGLSREEVYIANIIKCRPPGNRNPLDDEIATCIGFLERQIEVIKPEVIMSLGNVPTQILLKTERGITALRGKFFDYKGIKVMPTFHPSYLLRDSSKKWLTWNDATVVLKLLGIEVIHPSQNFSTKQNFD